MSRMTLSGDGDDDKDGDDDGDGDGNGDGDGVNLEEEADERRNSCKLVYCRPLKKACSIIKVEALVNDQSRCHYDHL